MIVRDRRWTVHATSWLQFWPRTSFINIRATSPTRLRARDHCTLSTLVGGKGGVGPSSLHIVLEGHNKVSECTMDIKFTWILTWQQTNNISWSFGLFSQTTARGRLDAKTKRLWRSGIANHFFIRFHHVWEPRMNRNHRNIIGRGPGHIKLHTTLEGP